VNAITSPNPRILDVDDLARFDALVAGGATSMHGWHVHSVDLRKRTAQLARLTPAGAVFLGCRFAAGMEESLRSGGALIFPHLPGVPFEPYRGRLYTGKELYAGVAHSTYEQTPDARVYQWSLQEGKNRSLDATLATAIHDHSIGDALEEVLADGELAGRRTVGVMGGHAAPRGSRNYDDAARLGRLLAREGHLVATGGGPGAMEAANLGAYLSGRDEDALTEALAELARVPGFRPSISAWARAAAAVVDRFPGGTANLGIPTWFYGHEPPNLFATHIAKYFANAVREAVLLARCDAGIIFLPGAAGTVQEIFQDACENYYAAPETVAPMVLVGERHWQRELPVWELMQRLAEGRPMAEQLFCVDTVEQAVEVLAARSS
jgi:predicted Rossmann-fold nucleotide-binding protein